MALNDTTDRPVSRHGEYRTAEEIERENYLLEQGKAVPSAEWTELDYYKITIAGLISNEPSNDPYVLNRIRDLAKEKERDDEISLMRLERVPKGWKPVKTYFGDFSRPSEALASARQEAKRVALERGFGPGARFGVYFDTAPSVRPYAEPQTCVSLYIL